jgi:hypothetical protein
MNNSLLKKITITLFSIVILLLIVNIVISKLADKNEQLQNRDSLSGIEIDKLFHTALKNYGFGDSWVAKKKIRKLSGDSLYATYSVKVPKDVPIHILILEMKNLFWDYDVLIDAEELTAGKNSLVKLSSENKLKLAADFFYDENVLRQFGSIAFLVSDLPIDDEELLNELLKTPELYYVLLVPGSESKKKLDVLAKAEKRFAILLNDDITELDYKLSSTFAENRILRSIKEIVTSFYSAAFFVIDEKSDLYESKNYTFIQSQLQKRGIVIVPTNKFESLNSNSVNVDSKFQDYMLKIDKADEKILLVSLDEYLSIAKLIPTYRKVGFKFINPGDIIIKR